MTVSDILIAAALQISVIILNKNIVRGRTAQINAYSFLFLDFFTILMTFNAVIRVFSRC